MKRLILSAITFYRRYLSPLKGYSCAYRVHTGHDSCSAYGQRVINRHGLGPGLLLLRRRLQACGAVHRQQSYRPVPTALSVRHRAQAGFCDVPAEVCEVASCACDITNCIDLSARKWWPWGKNKQPADEQPTGSDEA